MDFRELAVSGAWEIAPPQFRDERGAFLEWFKQPAFAGVVGHTLRLAQGNLSVSSAGVLRGIHFADVPPGQAKFVTCVAGMVFDVAVDLRIGSPTFGSWDSVLLDDIDHRAIYLSEGLGHAFLSLAEDSTVMYVCSEEYAPDRERGIHPLDEELAICWPTEDADGRPLHLQLSDKDEAAPTLAQARDQGILPSADEVQRYVASLKD